MPTLQAIVFDLDDTLYPEKSYILSAFQAVATWTEARLSIPRQRGFAELAGLYEAGVSGDTFDRWLSSHGFAPDDWVPEMVRVYRRHDPRIAPYDGVERLLGRLRERFRLGLVSDGYLETQRKKLASLCIGSFFDVVVFSDEWGREAWKPSPIPFERALEELRVAGHEAVYVADNPAKDFLGARRAGMWTIRVRRPEGVYSRLEPPSADHAPHVEIPSLEHLEPALERLGSAASTAPPVH
jgi:putative hydrolase of the HAD superfamily